MPSRDAQSRLPCGFLAKQKLLPKSPCTRFATRPANPPLFAIPLDRGEQSEQLRHAKPSSSSETSRHRVRRCSNLSASNRIAGQARTKVGAFVSVQTIEGGDSPQLSGAIQSLLKSMNPTCRQTLSPVMDRAGKPTSWLATLNGRGDDGAAVEEELRSKISRPRWWIDGVRVLVTLELLLRQNAAGSKDASKLRPRLVMNGPQIRRSTAAGRRHLRSRKYQLRLRPAKHGFSCRYHLHLLFAVINSRITTRRHSRIEAVRGEVMILFVRPYSTEFQRHKLPASRSTALILPGRFSSISTAGSPNHSHARVVDPCWCWSWCRR